MKRDDLELRHRLEQFIESEMRSCSMDFGCITPLYVYRMWGGVVALDVIERCLFELHKCSIMN